MLVGGRILPSAVGALSQQNCFAKFNFYLLNALSLLRVNVLGFFFVVGVLFVGFSLSVFGFMLFLFGPSQIAQMFARDLSRFVGWLGADKLGTVCSVSSHVKPGYSLTTCASEGKLLARIVIFFCAIPAPVFWGEKTISKTACF